MTETRPNAKPQRPPLPRLIAFDLDDTLAPSKARVPDEILNLLAELLIHTQVAVISGGALTQFRTQLLDPLAEFTRAGGSKLSEQQLEALHIMPTCGTHYERRGRGQWQTVYRETLTPAERDATITALQAEAKRLGHWPDQPWGEVIEDRGSQVTFSALGQAAPHEAKAVWDPSGAKKNELAAAVARRLPELEVRSGGSTSVDVTRRGIDKAYGMRELMRRTNISPDEILFIGDRLDPAGNDYPVIATGVRTHAVSGWQDTARFLESLLRGR